MRPFMFEIARVRPKRAYPADKRPHRRNGTHLQHYIKAPHRHLFNSRKESYELRRRIVTL